MRIKETIVIAVVTLLSFSSVLVGCSENNSIVHDAVTMPTVAPVIQVKPTPIQEEKEKQFSYIDQLPNERLKAFELFVSDKNAHHLEGFSPEEVLLIYLHSASMADVESIYALTYNNGKLPDADTLRQEYNENLLHREQGVALEYRYYESIEAQEGMVKENEIAIGITASIGNFTATTVYGLKKENNVWKMDLYHLIEHFKSKTKKS